MGEEKTERYQFLVICDICEDDPNESSLTTIRFNSANQLEFKSYNGFTADDIYRLLRGEETK